MLPITDDRMTQQAARSLLHQLDEDNASQAADVEELRTLRQHVRASVYYLLTRDFEHLIRICYRMDIPESDFAAALGGATMDAVAEHLADSMIRRERNRLKTLA